MQLTLLDDIISLITKTTELKYTDIVCTLCYPNGPLMYLIIKSNEMKIRPVRKKLISLSEVFPFFIISGGGHAFGHTFMCINL